MSDTKRKIAVVYDTSFLTGNFLSLKKFILARRFASKERAGLFGSLVSKFIGKGGAEQTVYHEAGDLFLVAEVIPKEVIAEVKQRCADGEGGQKVIAELLRDGASRVELALDTVVGDLVAGVQQATDVPAEMNEHFEKETDDKIVRYAARLASHRTRESYDLAIVATEDTNLLAKLAEMAQGGRAVLGVKSDQLAATTVLQDRLTEIANVDRANKVTVGN